MAIKVSAKSVAKAAAGSIIIYTMYGFNAVLMDLMLGIPDPWITMITFLLGLYNVAATAVTYLVSKTLGSMDQDVVKETKKEAEAVQSIATEAQDIGKQKELEDIVEKALAEKLGEEVE